MIPMNSASFMSLEYGAIGNIYFYRTSQVPQHIREKIIDHNVREASHGLFNPPAGLTKNDYNQLFLNFLIKERTSNNEMIDEHSDLDYIAVQVGNMESLNALSELENDPSFKGYQNPHFVDFFKQFSI